MTDTPSGGETNAIPEDITTLYARAQMQGTRYWDFSASRNEVRGQFRHRIVREEGDRAVEVSPPLRLAQVPQSLSSQPLPPQPLLSPQPSFEETLRSGPVRVPDARLQPTIAPPSERPGQLRWHALRSLFAATGPTIEPTSPLGGPRPPLLALFSLAGGVGKTCLVATLGRALAALGENVLLADTAACGLLPFYFGAREAKPGHVRTFSRPGAKDDAPVHVLNLQADLYPGDGGEHDPLLGELLRGGRGAGRILVDVATGSREVATRLMQLRPTVLVPILPDISSLACLASLEAMLAGADTFHLLNQFDPTSQLHLDIQELLRNELGDRLLPFVLRRGSAVGEALAEGMTVIDYAPGSAAAEDYWSLAAWLRNFAASADVSYGGVRWSER
jgi:cellulose biosynthesis protein BcsQ